jgi:hypothetical protein
MSASQAKADIAYASICTGDGKTGRITKPDDGRERRGAEIPDQEIRIKPAGEHPAKARRVSKIWDDQMSRPSGRRNIHNIREAEAAILTHPA